MFDSLAYRFSQQNRKKKLQLFFATMHPESGDTILDVGVNTIEYSASDNYLEKQYPYPEQITAVGLDNSKEFSLHYPRVRIIQANGTNLPFKNNQFRIGYSNAVLEHVGDKDKQVAFIKELHRVSQKGYLAIPYKYFPVEIHTRIPLLHLLLPKHWFDRVASMVGKHWAARDYMRFIGEQEFRLLLKEAGVNTFVIHKQRLFGFTVTLVATWHKDNSATIH